MDKALAELDQYRLAFDEFRQNRSERLALEQSMAQQSEVVIAAADEALANASSAMQQQKGSSYMLLGVIGALAIRSEEHTSELQSLMRISYAVFCLKKKQKAITQK